MKTKRTVPAFTRAQWEFLAVLAAFGEPVHIGVLDRLTPLLPGDFLDLVERGKEHGLLVQAGSDVFAFGAAAIPAVQEKIAKLQHPARMDELLARIAAADTAETVSPAAVMRLLALAGRNHEAAAAARDLAGQASRAGDPERAGQLLEYALSLVRAADRAANPDLFCSIVLDLAALRYRMGTNLGEIPDLLMDAQSVAAAAGNRRSHALLGMHLGRFYYLGDHLGEAIEAMTAAFRTVEELGDDDIRDQAAAFSGLLFYIQGKLPAATEHFTRAMQAAARRETVPDDLYLPAYLGFCTAGMGYFHKAVGLLDSNWRRSREQYGEAVACRFRAVLGIVLLMMGKTADAHRHLAQAHDESVSSGNIVSAVIAEMGLACGEFLDGRVRQSYERTANVVAGMRSTDMILRSYPLPLFLEMLAEYARLGYAPLPGFDVAGEMARIVTGPNVHLRGAALRIMAGRDEDAGRAWTRLKESETCLSEAGDPLQLAKTHIDMARLLLRNGDEAAARDAALRAWEEISGCGGTDFPPDIAFLLEGRTGADGASTAPHGQEHLLRMIEQLLPLPDPANLFGALIEATMSFFRAERGAMFLCSGGRGRPKIKTAQNLSVDEAYSPGFRESLAAIGRSFRQNKPAVIRVTDHARHASLSAICLPFHVQGRVRGVLYYDNSYLGDSFTAFDGALLARLTRSLSGYVERIWSYGGGGTHEVTARDESAADTAEAAGFLTQNARMKEILEQLDRVSDTSSTVLILGETGVGKELLARRVHAASRRGTGPFIVVDPGGIPETLVDSELFGHEKGAFTGADRQRKGRIELAHGGTLFIDEIGEIPLSLQVKLLRVLQEKEFVRIGGSRPLSSDFRLVAATNRDLEAEVEAGRFRRDLYYRLAVVPVTVPPLRERKDDIPLLARHFLNGFAREFNRRPPALGREDEALLVAYPWPGNVRELKNAMERAALLGTDDFREVIVPPGAAAAEAHPFDDVPSLEEVQRRYIRYVLDRSGGRIAGRGGAAELLGMRRTTLYARMRKLGMRP